MKHQSPPGEGGVPNTAPSLVVTDAMVNAACWAFFGKAWGSQKPDEFARHRPKLKADMRHALEAALFA